MKEPLQQWVSQRARLPGVLACGLRFADKTCFTESWSSDFPVQNLDHAWRCASDAFQVLRVNFFPNERVRWVYEKALLHCACREDGICLGIFTAQDGGGVDPAEIERLLVEFCAMRAGAAGS